MSARKRRSGDRGESSSKRDKRGNGISRRGIDLSRDYYAPSLDRDSTLLLYPQHPIL